MSLMTGSIMESGGDQHGFVDGTFRDPDTGLEVAVAGTAYGDGRYLRKRWGRVPRRCGCDRFGSPGVGIQREGAAGRPARRNLQDAREAEFIAENGLFTVSLPDGRMVEINTDYEYDEEGYEDEE